MKCRLHYSSDTSSAVGICASCLRERLFLLISAQSSSHTHQLQLNLSESDDHHRRRNSDPPPPQPPPLTFPRSVSPYVARRKFDNDIRLDFSDQKFHSTPEIGAPITESVKKKKRNKFSFITNLFKSRSDKSESDQRTASTASPLWSNSNKSVPRFVGQRISTQNHRVSDRGMSPQRPPRDGEEESSSRSSESCEPTWKQTPVSSSSSAAAPNRRRHSNMSGLAFCLSPLVRASPNNRNWNWKSNSLPPESGSGDVGAAASRKAARLAVANSFCKNRSKKMADFGRGGGGYGHQR